MAQASPVTPPYPLKWALPGQGLLTPAMLPGTVAFRRMDSSNSTMQVLEVDWNHLDKPFQDPGHPEWSRSVLLDLEYA